MVNRQQNQVNQGKWMQNINVKRFHLYIRIGAYWAALWLFSYLVAHPLAEFPRWFVNEIWRAIYLIALNFIFFEYALPSIREKRKYFLIRIFLSLFVLWVMLMLYTFGLYAWRHIGIQLHLYTPFRTDASTSRGVAVHALFSLFSIVFFGVLVHVFDYRKLKGDVQQLRLQKQEAELNYLKSQTNPHFLFNTLNNIYSLAKDKSDLAPESILRLSKILRFMLYETSSNTIPIEKEVKVISDYIGLEKLRYDDSLRIDFEHKMEDVKQPIPPLLLIPLVENAFKHGASETRDQPFVEIHLSATKEQLTFLVRNSMEKTPGETDVKENIGLSNLRRQLELLYTDYELSVQHGDAVFTARLNIHLASHV